MNLFNALSAPASALDAMQQALTATQQNLLNATTPGYAKQRATLNALPFDPAQGMPGGVAFALAGDTRSQYAENAVWRQIGAQSEAKEYVRALSTLQPFLSAGESGLSTAMRDFFRAANDWSSAPTDASARQGVINNAQKLAVEFQGIGDHLQWMATQVDQGIASTVEEINGILGKLRDAGSTPLEDASAFAALEELSAKVGISARKESDGSFTVEIPGVTTLLTRSSSFPLRVQGSRVITAEGTDITVQLSGGKLKALLDAQTELVSLTGDENSQGALNQLAAAVAGGVNTLFRNGLVSPGPPAVQGQDLFTWDQAHPNATMRTMALASGASADTLPAYSAGPPADPAGTAKALANLDAARTLGGRTFEKFHEDVMSGVATRFSAKKASSETLASAVETAMQYRSELSGVSVEEEAVTLLSIQRAYESSARVIKVVDEMLATTIDLIR